MAVTSSAQELSNISLTPSTPTPTPTPTSTARLSIPFPLRLPIAILTASTAGFGLGITHGSTEAGLRFRAENAHRLPQSQAGWYLYHKSKNYHVILGGVYEGWRMSLRLGVWAGLFVLTEEGVDRGRAAVVRGWRRNVQGRGGEEVEGVPRDFVSTVLAGLGTAGAFSAWSRFPMPTAVRLAKMGGKAGLRFGLLQDAVSLLRGRELGYVEFIKRRTFASDEKEVKNEMKVTAG